MVFLFAVGYFTTPILLQQLENAIETSYTSSQFTPLFFGLTAFTTIFYFAIMIFTGWITVRKYKGTVRNAIIATLALSILAVVWSPISTIITYNQVPSYRQLIEPIFTLSDIILVNLFSGVINVFVSVALGVAGATWAKKKSRLRKKRS